MKIFLVMIISLSVLCSKEPPDSLNPKRLIALTGLTAAGFTVSQIIQYDVYWSDRSNFSVMDLKTEYKDALLADKGGHYFISYAMSKTYAKALEWTGLNKNSTVWFGAGASLIHQTYVEVNDGFSEGEVYLGFSIGDMFANIGGAAWPVAQHYYPVLEEINFKINFNKSVNYNLKGYENISNDYESTYHWATIDILDLLNLNKGPQGMLQLAIGHSVKNIDRLGKGYHEFYLGMDINWKHLLNYKFVKNNYYLQLLVEVLDKYRFPLPSLRISPNVTFYGFQR
ncbi:DUF2279 domain-containing protein [Candidatus Kapabacteria bacterium]|nr:DUF2279 domain-containing protein [Candidatus Kapabacteria bacterium]